VSAIWSDVVRLLWSKADVYDGPQHCTLQYGPDLVLLGISDLVRFEKMICRYENMQQKLSEKCDVGEMTKLESRIKQLEDKLSYFEPEVDQRFHSIEHRLPTTTSCGHRGTMLRTRK